MCIVSWHTLLDIFFISLGSPVPVIHTEPSGDDTHVFVGSSFFLPCETDGLTDTYQWMRDGIVLSSNSNFTIETGVGLHVLNAGTSNSGVYTCVASNDIGSVNISAVVVVTDSVITCDGQSLLDCGRCTLSL